MQQENNNSYRKVPENPEELKGLLYSSLNKLAKVSPTNQQISIAHQQIGLAMKNQAFMQVIIELILEHQSKPDRQTFLTQIATTFTTYLRHQQARSHLVYKISPNELNKQLIQIYIDPSINSTTKEGMMKHYPQFIYAAGMEIIRSQTVEKLCDSIGSQCLNLLENINEEDFLQSEKVRYFLLLMPLAQMIAKGPIESISMKNIVKQFLKPGLCIAVTYIYMLQLSIETNNQLFFSQNINIARKLVEFIKDLIIHACKSNHMHYLQAIIFQQILVVKLIKMSLSLSLKAKGEKLVNEVMIDCSKGAPILDNLNIIKQHCMDITMTLAKQVIDSERRKKQKSKNLLESSHQKVVQIIRFILENMIEPFISELQAFQYDKNKIPHGFCKSFVSTLSYFVRISQFYNESLGVRNALLYNVCLPLLIAPDPSTIKSAQDFIYRREDILNTQSMDLLENAASKLIESYIDKIDGTVHQLSNYMVDMIKFQLSANPNTYSFLSQDITESYFFKNVDYLVQIQCELTVIALICYTAPGRMQIMSLVQEFFIEKSDFFLKDDLPGTLKSAIFLCYTYYVDDFYKILISRNSSNRTFHLKILEQFCVEIKKYTQIQNKISMVKQQRVEVQIAALQAMDSLSNCLTQKNLIPALFRVEGPFTEQLNQEIFLNLFKFLVFETQYIMNIGAIDIIKQFLLQNLKFCYGKGYALPRFHYKSDGIPSIIRKQLCQFLGTELIKIYLRNDIPNHILMKAKIMNTMEQVVTCCSEPDKVLTRQFFSLKAPEYHEWDSSNTIDIYLRRMLVMKQEGKEVNLEVLDWVLQYSFNQLQIAVKGGELKALFGIFINLVMIHPPIIDRIVDPLASTLLHLMKEDLESPKYDQKLDEVVRQLAYILMISIKLNFSDKNKGIWGGFVTALQNHYQQTSQKGYILFSSSNPFIGKTLATCLIYIYHIRHNSALIANLSFLFKNILTDQYMYKSKTQKLIVAQTLLNLLGEKETIPENDRECQISMNMVCNLYHSCFSMMIDKEQDSDEDLFDDEESADQDGENQKLNYKAYTLACNSFTERENKEQELLALKNLCHKLKQKSPQFLKNVVQGLSFPVQTFVKQKVYYFEGKIQEHGLRKILKVKK